MSEASLSGLGKCARVGKAIVATTATIASLTACVTIQAPPIATSPSPVPSVAISPSPVAATSTPVAVAPVSPPVTISTSAAPAVPKAPAGMLVLGTASTGQTVSLDTNSIPFDDGAYANATYYLGEEKLAASIHCGQSYWTVKGDSTRYTPQSKATQNLVTIACQIRQLKEKAGRGYFVVFDPPSNVRLSPNGSVKCVIEKMEIITISVELGLVGGWYQTEACGGGWISESQVRSLSYKR
jgi:hypothetical protein